MGKIIITGPGRSGTTFVIRLLAELGFDTGFDPEDPPYREEWRAGCEWRANVDYTTLTTDELQEVIDAAPRIVKSPDWSVWLKTMLSDGVIEVDHLIVPFRDLDVSAKSRVGAGLDWLMPDDIGDEHRVEFQGNIHAMALGRVVEAAMLYSVPMTIMHFPLLVEDVDYCYSKLSVIFDVDYDEFKRAFGKLARPEQVRWK